MSERLITFDELSENRYMLEGMLVECPFDIAGEILVGEIMASVWWHDKHMKEFQLAEARSWNPVNRSWTCRGAYLLRFKFEHFEQFSGPYERENGEIFFILGTSFYIRLFHADRKWEPPIGFDPLHAVHQRFMNPDVPKDPIS